MEILFNNCGYIHESPFSAGTSEDVIKAVESCKLRAGGSNILCAHPSIGFSEDCTDLTASEELLFLLSKSIDKQVVKDYLNLIKVLDNFSYLTFKWDFTQRIEGTMTESVIMGDDTLIGSQKVLELGGSYLREICSIILRCRTQNKVLNNGEKARIRFLIIEIQKDIEKGIRGICVTNNIEID